MSSPGVVYVLCFDQPYHHARHYIGWTNGDALERLEQHLAGNGSPLVRAVVAAGIAVRLVLSMPGDRGTERRLKNRHRPDATYRLCPRCRARRTGARQLRLFARGRRAVAPDLFGRIAA